MRVSINLEEEAVIVFICIGNKLSLVQLRDMDRESRFWK